MLEDIMKIRTRWMKNIIAGVLVNLAKKNGYDIGLDIGDIEIKHVEGDDGKDHIGIDAKVHINTNTKTIEKLIQKG